MNATEGGPKCPSSYSRLMVAHLRRFLFVVGFTLVAWLLWSIGSDAQTTSLQDRVTPQEVLILFNTRWPDENGNYRSDSQDVAEYYAARRGIPTGHLLGLAVTDGQGKPDML